MPESEIRLNSDYWFYAVDFGPIFDPNLNKIPKSWYGLFQYIFMKNNRWESLSSSLVWKGVNQYCKMMSSHIPISKVDKKQLCFPDEVSVDLNQVYTYIANK